MNIFVLIAGMRETMREAGYSRQQIDEKSLAVTKAADYDAACALVFAYTAEAEAVAEELKEIAKQVAVSVKNTAERHGYGLGECSFYIAEYTWEHIQETHDEALAYDVIDGEELDWATIKTLEAEQPDIYATWMRLRRNAREILNA